MFFLQIHKNLRCKCTSNVVSLQIHKNLRYKMYFEYFFADSQEVENKSVGPRAVGRHLPREGRSRHHPDGLRQLQEGDERDQTVRDAHGLLRQSRKLPGFTIVQHLIQRFISQINCIFRMKQLLFVSGEKSSFVF
jgi:hypothetical protein